MQGPQEDSSNGLAAVRNWPVEGVEGTQLQRTYCEGLYGAPPAEPNRAFYSELDEQLRLQHNTLSAVRDKLVVDSLVAAGHGELDTVAMRQAVNSSLSRQMEFFTSCLAQYSGGDMRPCSCPTCNCCCARIKDAAAY